MGEIPILTGQQRGLPNFAQRQVGRGFMILCGCSYAEKIRLYEIQTAVTGLQANMA